MREAVGDWAVMTDSPAEGQELLLEEQAEVEGWLALVQTPSGKSFGLP